MAALSCTSPMFSDSVSSCIVEFMGLVKVFYPLSVNPTVRLSVKFIPGAALWLI